MGSKAEKRDSGSGSVSGCVFRCGRDSGARPPSSTFPLMTECTTATTGCFKECDTKVGHM